MFWDSVQRAEAVGSPRVDRDRVESWVRAQMALESALEAQAEASSSGGAGDSDQPDSRRSSSGRRLSSPQLSQHAGSDVSSVEVTMVTPFRSEDGTHMLYALTCRRGDKQWRICERYSSIRRVYEIAKVSYPFVAGRRSEEHAQSGGKHPPFPGKTLRNSAQAALERAEGLLLWLSTYSNVPVVADFLMGDRSMTGGPIDVRTVTHDSGPASAGTTSTFTPSQSHRSTQAHSQASTVATVGAMMVPLDAVGTAAKMGSEGEAESMGTRSARAQRTYCRPSSAREVVCVDDTVSRGASRHQTSDDPSESSARSSVSGGTLPSHTGSVCEGSEGGSGRGDALGGWVAHKGARGMFRTLGLRRADVPSPVKELSPYSASPSSARGHLDRALSTSTTCTIRSDRASVSTSHASSSSPQRTAADASLAQKHTDRLLRATADNSTGCTAVDSAVTGASDAKTPVAVAGPETGGGTKTGGGGSSLVSEAGEGVEGQTRGAGATASRKQSISQELQRLLNGGSFWRAGRLASAGTMPPASAASLVTNAAGGERGANAGARSRRSAKADVGSREAIRHEGEREATARDFKTVSLRAKAEQWLLKPEEVTVGRRMGQGAGGVIYHAKWRGLDVVAKMLRPESEREGNIKRQVARNDLINEICLLSHLRHPCLVMFLGAVLSPEDGGETLLILNEYMPGGNLEDYFESRYRQLGHPWTAPMERVLQLSIELARAVSFLHNCNPPIIHRDLKPANLLLTASGRLKVCDFGLSRVKDQAFRTGTYRMTGKTGSLRYMAPEVFQQDPKYDEKVDIYSLALILHYICLGVQPLRNMSGQTVAIHATRDEARPPLDQIRQERGLPMAELIRRCWAPRGKQRPSALEILQLLEVIALWEQTAKHRVAMLSRADQATARALYHCVTVGRCTASPPARWRRFARQCWTKWVSYDGMTQSEARSALVKFLQIHCGLPLGDFEPYPRACGEVQEGVGASTAGARQGPAAAADGRGSSPVVDASATGGAEDSGDRRGVQRLRFSHGAVGGGVERGSGAAGRGLNAAEGLGESGGMDAATEHEAAGAVLRASTPPTNGCVARVLRPWRSHVDREQGVGGVGKGGGDRESGLQDGPDLSDAGCRSGGGRAGVVHGAVAGANKCVNNGREGRDSDVSRRGEAEGSQLDQAAGADGASVGPEERKQQLVRQAVAFAVSSAVVGLGVLTSNGL